MDKQGFVIVVLSTVVAITLVAAVIHEKSLNKEPANPPAPIERTYGREVNIEPRTPDLEKMERTGVYDPNDPGLTPPPVRSNPEQQQQQQQQQLNAMDVLAPGYNKANERIEHVKKIKRKALEAGREDIDNLNLER